MVTISRTTFTVPVVGVGRQDYSQSVERSVESLISSYQGNFNIWDSFIIPAGGSITRDYALPIDFMVLVYTFRLSVPKNILIRLAVYPYISGAFVPVPPNDESAYQTIYILIQKGNPLSDYLRIIAYNYDSVDVTARFTSEGIQVSRDQYYSVYFPPP